MNFLYSTIQVKEKSEANPLIEINFENLMKSNSPEPGLGYLNKLKLLSSIEAEKAKPMPKNNIVEINENNINQLLKSTFNNNKHKRNISDFPMNMKSSLQGSKLINTNNNSKNPSTNTSISKLAFNSTIQNNKQARVKSVKRNPKNK